MLREPEWLEAAAQLGPRQLAADHRIQDVAGQPALGVAGHPLAQELQSYDRHRLAQGETVEIRQGLSVLDRHQPGLGHIPGRSEEEVRPAGVPSAATGRARARLGSPRRA